MTELSMLSKHKLVKAILVVLAVFATVRCADQNVDPGKCIREERYQIPVEKTFQEAYSVFSHYTFCDLSFLCPVYVTRYRTATRTEWETRIRKIEECCTGYDSVKTGEILSCIPRCNSTNCVNGVCRDPGDPETCECFPGFAFYNPRKWGCCPTYLGTSYCEKECSSGWGKNCANDCKYCTSFGSIGYLFCNHIDGACDCRNGFKGYFCDIPIVPCPRGTYGLQGMDGECKPCNHCFEFNANCNSDPWKGVCKCNDLELSYSEEDPKRRCIRESCPNDHYGTVGDCKPCNCPTFDVDYTITTTSMNSTSINHYTFRYDGGCREEGKCRYCPLGYKGYRCNTEEQKCPPGTYGMVENGEECKKCKCPRYANCDPWKGKCKCDNPEATITKREKREDSFCKLPCKCENGGVCPEYDENPMCSCPDAFTGLRCEKHVCPPGTFAEPNPDQYRPLRCETCDCSSNSITQICNQTNGQCNCIKGYKGRDCGTECPCGSKSTTCEPDLFGKCYCLPGFAGTKCDEKCQPGSNGANCPSRCNCLDDEECNPVDGECFKLSSLISEE